MFLDPTASPNTLADQVVGTLPTPTPPGERRSIELAIRFASETMREAATILLDHIAGYRGNLQPLDLTTILRLISEDFEAWRRRPSAPEEGPIIDLTSDLLL